MKTQLILSLCTLLTACSSGQPQGNTGKYKPVVNPHPQYFLTIHKSLTMSLSRLKAVTQYVAYNQQCNIVTNKFEGARAYRSKAVIHYPSDNQQNILRIPFDRYLPGFCQWYGYLVSLYYKGNDGHYRPIANINVEPNLPKPDKAHKDTSVHLVCNNIDCIPRNYQMITNYNIPFYQNIAMSIDMNFIDNK